jgi:DNA-binding response OmpR family regulator
MNPIQTKGKILIIDDDEKISEFLRLFFLKKGFEVMVVVQAEEAEKSIELSKPDLIFLDYRMTPVTGKDILERLKIRGDRTPVVMMSAYKRRHGDLEMKRLGALAYLAKPFDFEEIEEILTRVFDN